MEKWIQVWGKERGEQKAIVLMSFQVIEGTLEEVRNHAEDSKKLLEDQGVTEVRIEELDE